MHAVGFWHEQQRPDRDKYVWVDPSLQETTNYMRMDWTEPVGEYDFCSIMHYYLSSKMKAKHDNIRCSHRVGSADTLSPMDVEKINIMYNCKQDISGVVNSPNYPYNYGDDIRDSTTIEVEDSAKIELTFIDFEIEDEENCGFDYVSGIYYCHIILWAISALTIPSSGHGQHGAAEGVRH